MDTIRDHSKERTGGALNDEVDLTGRGIDGVQLITPSGENSEGFLFAPCGDGL